MSKTHGNCAVWTQESEEHVYCQHDMLPGCWYSKHGNASKYPCWRPRHETLHLKLLKLVVESYDERRAEPLSVIAHCDNGRKYLVQPSHEKQVMLAGWKCDYYRYTESGNGYLRKTWTGPVVGIVVVADSEVGA